MEHLRMMMVSLFLPGESAILDYVWASAAKPTTGSKIAIQFRFIEIFITFNYCFRVEREKHFAQQFSKLNKKLFPKSLGASDTIT